MKKGEKKIIEQTTSRFNVADTAESTLQYLSLWPDSKGQDTGDNSPPAWTSLTINDPLDPPDTQCDDETNSIPGAAGAVGYCGGHHGGQRKDDDSSIKHLSENTHTHCYACSFHSGMTLREWHCSEMGPRVSGLMGPMGAYLYFVLYVIPYPQHHDPEHRLRQREGQREGNTHAEMENTNGSWTLRG